MIMHIQGHLVALEIIYYDCLCMVPSVLLKENGCNWLHALFEKCCFELFTAVTVTI